MNLLLIIVKAELGLSNVVDSVVKYAEGFLKFESILGVCVTHMDTIDAWTEADFRRVLKAQCGIEEVIFTSLATKASDLEDGVLSLCRANPLNATVDSEEFLKLFRINDNNLRILVSVRKEVENFESIKRQFYQLLSDGTFKGDADDALYEFQVWMTEQVVEAQKRLAEEHNFDFYGPSLANEAGHVANLSKQLEAALLEIRARCFERAPNHTDEMRRCPYCGEVFVKISGCDNVTCGADIGGGFDVRQGRGESLATYFFNWLRDTGRFEMRRRGVRGRQSRARTQQPRGCGRSLNWASMPVVAPPPEMMAAHHVTTEDVPAIPPFALESWNSEFDLRFAGCEIKENE